MTQYEPIIDIENPATYTQRTRMDRNGEKVSDDLRGGPGSLVICFQTQRLEDVVLVDPTLLAPPDSQYSFPLEPEVSYRPLINHRVPDLLLSSVRVRRLSIQSLANPERLQYIISHRLPWKIWNFIYSPMAIYKSG